MRQLPWVIGAIAATVAGVACGSTVNTNPLSRWDGQTLGEFANHQPPAISPDRYLEMRGPQERYAMTTPEGVVPVEQLSDRGLYANDRFARTWYADTPEDYDNSTSWPQQAAATMPVSDSPASTEPASKAQIDATNTRPLELTRPVQLADARPVKSNAVKSTGGAKVVDVAASLAAQSASQTIQ